MSLVEQRVLGVLCPPGDGKVLFSYIMVWLRVSYPSQIFLIFYFFYNPAGPRKNPSQSFQILFTRSHSRSFFATRVRNNESVLSATWLAERRARGRFGFRWIFHRGEL